MGRTLDIFINPNLFRNVFIFGFMISPTGTPIPYSNIRRVSPCAKIYSTAKILPADDPEISSRSLSTPKSFNALSAPAKPKNPIAPGPIARHFIF